MVLEVWYAFFISQHKLQNGSNLPRLTPTQSSPPLLFICIVMDFFAKMSCRLFARPFSIFFFLYICSVVVIKVGEYRVEASGS